MKKYFVIILTILLGVSLANAQKFNLLKNPSRMFHLSRPANVQLTNTVQRAAVQVPLQPMSTTALFHRAGNMEFWHAPVALPALEATPRVVASPAKRSRESLELEATAYDMPSYIAEKMSRDQLQEWLGTYLSFRNITKGVTSRRAQAQNLPVTNLTRRENFALSTMEQRKTAQEWAESQPDYFEENYVTDYQFRSRRYGGGLKPFVMPDNAPWRDKPLRILVVNDDPWIYERMYDGLDDPTVTLKYVAGPEEAKEFLAKRSDFVDVILLDLALADIWTRSLLEVPMYVYNHHLNIPVISNSAESTNDSWLLSYNIVGQYPPVTSDFEMPELIAYLKNIVHTGRARPQNDTPSLHSELSDENAFSRNDELLHHFGAKERQKLWKWAESQPDFYEDNYILSACAGVYIEPFHPDVKSMRVLLVSDDDDAIVRLRKAAKARGNITIDVVDRVSGVAKRLEQTNYDIVATDFVLPAFEDGYQVGMYVWNNKLNIPVVAIAKTEIGPARGLLFNLVGQAPYPNDAEQADAALRYLSHIAATGRALD